MEQELEAQEEPLLEKTQQPPRSVRRFSERCPAWTWLVQLLLATFSIGTLIVSRQDGAARSCSASLSPFSPALEAVPDASYEWQRFQGTVTTNSTYKGAPTAARRATWDELTRIRYFSIDDATLRRIGAPESSVKVPDELGGGYFAVLEVYHQLHCLKELWLNTYPEFADTDTDQSLRHQHLDHCADILRQKLLCDADVTPITLNWVQHVSHATPNFNVLHRCRSAEDIEAWMRSHEIVDSEGAFSNKPANAVELESFP
jgi:Mycotoxin biosynthesis protein UstYa